MAIQAISDMETGAQTAASGAGAIAPEKPAYLWSGEFADRVQEDEFRTATWAETLERTRAVQLAVYVFAACFAIDFFVLSAGPLLTLLAVGRFMSIPVCRIPLTFFSASADHKKFFAALTASQLYLFGVFLIAVYAGSFRATEQSLSVLTIIFAFYFGVPNRLSLNAFASIVSTILFVGVISTTDGASMRSIGLVCILLLIGNFCGIQTIRVTSRLRRAEFLVLKQQRELNEQLTRPVRRWSGPHRHGFTDALCGSGRAPPH